MAKKRQAQGRLDFEYEMPGGPEDSVTSYGGLPLVVETMRALGVSDSARQHVKVARRERTHDEAALLESFVLLMAAGGDCLDDMKVLAEDEALCRMLGREFPSPETARRFLYSFHDEALMEVGPEKGAFVPPESEPLQGLARANEHLVKAVAARRPPTRATVDVDSTIQESNKREAKPHYMGGTGYQPAVAFWAEQDLVLADEFRDGNVPSAHEPLALVRRAFEALPSSVTERRFRGDSAFYNKHLMLWLTQEKVEFTLGGRMTEGLRGRLENLSSSCWELFEDRGDERVYVCEDVPYFPEMVDEVTGLRYLGICFEPRQHDFVKEKTRYLVVVTNRAGSARELVRWHWQKAGTIEQLHDVVKNELGGGVLPCGRFGANAAWFRMALLTYNVLSALKTIALPPELHDARPKRLRFQVFTIPGVVARHARKMLVRVRSRLQRGARLLAARLALWQPAPG